jgi:hypothetical protein
MTVAELIEKLREFPAEAVVARGDSDWGMVALQTKGIELDDPYDGVSSLWGKLDKVYVGHFDVTGPVVVLR